MACSLLPHLTSFTTEIRSSGARASTRQTVTLFPASSDTLLSVEICVCRLRSYFSVVPIVLDFPFCLPPMGLLYTPESRRAHENLFHHIIVQVLRPSLSRTCRVAGWRPVLPGHSLDNRSSLVSLLCQVDVLALATSSPADHE